jgi:hypothetical protein
MPTHRSIRERLERAKSPAAKRETAYDWALSWREDQTDIVRQLQRAIEADDYDGLCRATGQLKEVTAKRFVGLASVIEGLTAPSLPTSLTGGG